MVYSDYRYNYYPQIQYPLIYGNSLIEAPFPTHLERPLRAPFEENLKS